MWWNGFQLCHDTFVPLNNWLNEVKPSNNWLKMGMVDSPFTSCLIEHVHDILLQVLVSVTHYFLQSEEHGDGSRGLFISFHDTWGLIMSPRNDSWLDGNYEFSLCSGITHAFMIDTLLDLGFTDPLQLFAEYFLICNSFVTIEIPKYQHNLVFHYIMPIINIMSQLLFSLLRWV